MSKTLVVGSAGSVYVHLYVPVCPSALTSAPSLLHVRVPPCCLCRLALFSAAVLYMYVYVINRVMSQRAVYSMVQRLALLACVPLAFVNGDAAATTSLRGASTQQVRHLPGPSSVYVDIIPCK